MWHRCQAGFATRLPQSTSELLNLQALAVGQVSSPIEPPDNSAIKGGAEKTYPIAMRVCVRIASVVPDKALIQAWYRANAQSRSISLLL